MCESQILSLTCLLTHAHLKALRCVDKRMNDAVRRMWPSSQYVFRQNYRIKMEVDWREHKLTCSQSRQVKI